ncbi:MAG: hypothetical protein CMJ58_04080 [Planctomycetaceae bacterium]|nr:hypothetical protein [Planctomycetaceae bacterium]
MKSPRYKSSRRRFAAETLERRDLLAADLGNQGAVAGAVDCGLCEPVQTQAQVQVQSQDAAQAVQQQVQAALRPGTPFRPAPRGEAAFVQAQVKNGAGSQAEDGTAAQMQAQQENQQQGTAAAVGDQTQQQAREQLRDQDCDPQQTPQGDQLQQQDRDQLQDQQRDQRRLQEEDCDPQQGLQGDQLQQQDRDQLQDQQRDQLQDQQRDQQRLQSQDCDAQSSPQQAQLQQRQRADQQQQRQGDQQQLRQRDPQQDQVGQALTDVEIATLTFVREEEKLARDVYLTLAGTTTLPLFDNIAASEQSHMDAVGSLLDKYGIDDPVISDEVGVFTNPVLQQLFADLTSGDVVDLSYLGVDLQLTGGTASLEAALAVGAFVEEWDILDIMRGQDDVVHQDVANVYDNLLKGSRNHLRAFTGELDALGVVYDPVLMVGDDAELGDLDALYVAIVSSDGETGPQAGQAGAGSQDGTQQQARDRAFELIAI